MRLMGVLAGVALLQGCAALPPTAPSYDGGSGQGPGYNASYEEHLQAAAAESERQAELNQHNNAVIAQAHIEEAKHKRDLNVPCTAVTERQILAAAVYNPYVPRKVRLLKLLGHSGNAIPAIIARDVPSLLTASPRGLSRTWSEPTLVATWRSRRSIISGIDRARSAARAAGG